jgi:MerR family mercuric resistance operon transcriptional regulator
MTLTIGQLARSGSATVETIRYYEREGLLDPPERSASGYRAYGPQAIQRLVFIHRAQDLGFTLKEIRELITLQTNPDADCTAVRTAAEDKLGVIEKKLAQLQQMKAALEKVVGSCTGVRPMAECEILECLSHEADAAGCPPTPRA